MLHRTTASILVLALTSAPLPAAAQPVAEAAAVPTPPASPGSYDTVALRDGTVLRGTILELAPGRAVVIAVPSGETRTIAWPDVASTAFAGQAATRPEGPVPAATGPGDMPEPRPGPSRPRIFIESSRPVDLHLLEAGVPAFAAGGRVSTSAMVASARSVCRAPCGRVIDASAGYPYYFGGDRVVPSRAFFLRDLEGDYVARVRPGRWGLLYGGIFATGFSYGGVLTGAMLVAFTKGETRTAGGVVLGVGAALLISGIVMLVKGRTRYSLKKR